MAQVHIAHRYENGDTLLRIVRPAHWDDHRHCERCDGSDTLQSLYDLAFAGGGCTSWRAVCRQHVRQLMDEHYRADDAVPSNETHDRHADKQ